MGIVVGYISPIKAADIRWGAPQRIDPATWRPPRMDAQAFLEFVTATLADELFFAEQIKPFSEFGFVFPAAVAFVREVPAQARREIGTCYERRDRAVGRTKAGQPHFTTVQFVHIEDWSRARDCVAAELVRRKGM